MSTRLRWLTRQLLGVTWLALVTLLMALSALTHLAGHFDRQPFIVRGASMSPAIPQGALIIVRPVPAETIASGDVVTVRSDENAVITHRVVDVERSDAGELTFHTKGDGSTVPDAVPFAADAVIGVVELHVPFLGFVLAFLSMPSGLVAVLSALGALMIARWSLDEPRRERRAIPQIGAARPIAGG